MAHRATQMSATRPQVAVLIVTYNNAHTITSCLASVVQACDATPCSIHVWDNASQDATVSEIRDGFSGIALHESSQNIGFGAAVNGLALQTDAPFLLLLNPDAMISPNAITALLEIAHDTPQGAIFGGQAYDPNGALNPASRQRMLTVSSTWLRTFGVARMLPWLDTELGRRRVLTSPAPSDLVEGSMMLIRKPVWETLGGFDPAFFLYGEDLDLCRRAQQLGHHCMTHPHAKYTHSVGASSSDQTHKTMYILSARAELARRYTAPWHCRMIHAGLLTGVLLRMGVGSFMQTSTNWRVIWNMRKEWKTHPISMEDFSLIMSQEK